VHKASEIRLQMSKYECINGRKKILFLLISRLLKNRYICRLKIKWNSIIIYVLK